MKCDNKTFLPAQKKDGKVVMYDVTCPGDGVGVFLSPCKRCRTNHIFSVGSKNRTDIPLFDERSRRIEERFFIAK